MNRIEIVKILQAIKEGRLLPTDLRDKRIFIFWQKNYGRSQDFLMDEKTFTNDERLKFENEIEAGNIRRMACGMEEDIIISIEYINARKKEFKD